MEEKSKHRKPYEKPTLTKLTPEQAAKTLETLRKTNRHETKDKKKPALKALYSLQDPRI